MLLIQLYNGQQNGAEVLFSQMDKNKTRAVSTVVT